MSIIDRYIARQFLFNVAALFVILFCMVVAIDTSWNAGRYLNKAAKMAAQEGHEGFSIRQGTIAVLLVADLWWPRLLQLFNYMLGLVLVAAMGFTCTQMVRHRELVAVLASGQSLARVARPFLVVGVGMIGLQVLNQEFMLPGVAPLLTRDHGDAGERGLGMADVPLMPDGAGRLWYAKVFDADRGTLEGVYVWERDESGMALQRVYADRAVWEDGGWNFEGVKVESRQEARHAAVPAARLETDLSPTALRMRRYEGYSQNLSWRQLGQMLDRLDRLGAGAPETRQTRERLERIRYGRVSVIACNLLTLAICMPFFLTRVPGNMVLQSLKCAPVAIVALIGAVLGASTPVPGLAASVGVFIPTLVLLPLLVAMWLTVKT